MGIQWVSKGRRMPGEWAWVGKVCRTSAKWAPAEKRESYRSHGLVLQAVQILQRTIVKANWVRK